MKFFFSAAACFMFLLLASAKSTAQDREDRGVKDLKIQAEYMDPKNLALIINEARYWVLSKADSAMLDRAEIEIPQTFSKAKMLMQISDLLPQIIRASSGSDGYADKVLAMYEQALPIQSYRNARSTENIFFIYTADGRFQVEGVEPDRLAYNDGRRIYFNLQALLKKKFSLIEIVQLWLHEIIHLDRSTPLDIKDKWVARAATYVQNNFQELKVGRDHSLYVLNMPELRMIVDKDRFLNLNFPAMRNYGMPSASDYLREQIKSHFMVFEQLDNELKIFEEVYDGFRILDSYSFPVGYLDHLHYGQIFNWPRLSISSAKLNTSGQLVITYENTPTSFIRSSERRFGFIELNDRNPIQPFHVTNSLRMEISLQTGQKNIVPNYQRPLADGDFEVNRIEDRGDRRFLSLRLKLDNISKVLNGKISLHLLAKDLSDPQLLSWRIANFRILNPNEALLHLEIPAHDMELSQILIPKIGHGGWYSEQSIRPSRPYIIRGTKKIQSNQIAITDFQLSKKELKTDKIKAEISVKSQKKIVGITLDMQHGLMSASVSTNNVPIPFERHESESSRTTDRKYYLPTSQFVFKNSVLRFEIPEALIESTTQGPVITEKLSAFYTHRYSNTYKTTWDRKTRQIMAMWIHFEDGTIEKLKPEILPGTFTLMSAVEQAEREKQIGERIKRDLGIEEYACSKIFN